MRIKKILGVVGAIGAGFVAGAAVGYVRGLREMEMSVCPENCECQGECAMCAGAHTVAAEAQAAADVMQEVPVEAPVAPTAVEIDGVPCDAVCEAVVSEGDAAASTDM